MTHPSKDSGRQLRTSRRHFLRAAATAAAMATTGITAHAQMATPSSATPVAVPQRPVTEPRLQVFPAPGTVTASPGTEISFRNVTPEALGAVQVEGEKSGGHSGVLRPHADGRGVSYVPDAPFEPDERVTVSAGIPLHPGGAAAIVFYTADIASRPQAPAERVIDDPDFVPRTFRSRPDLSPPPIEITTGAVNTAPGHVFVAPKAPQGQSGGMILDRDGELVWYRPAATDAWQINDLKVQQLNGQPVLTWWEGVSPRGYGYGHFVVMNSAYEVIHQVQAGNGYVGCDLHEFILTPRGTALIILYQPVYWDLTPVDGPTRGLAMDNIVQEIELETGRVLFEWHVLDHIDIEETYFAIPDDSSRPLDYVHVNSIEEDDDGNLIISGRNSHGVYKIDRATGDLIWRLHGRRSDFAMGEGTPFFFQHDARRQPDGTLTIFDNADDDPEAGNRGAASRGIVLDLDTETMTATLVREYIHETGILSVSQGNMQVLDNGNVFVGWGSAPVFTEYGPEGDMRFNGRFPVGTQSYRAYRNEWVGRPSARPDIDVQVGPGDEISIAVSWNGATGVATWRVLYGDQPGALSDVSTEPRAGFETVITRDIASPWIAVQALNSDGRVLVTSDPVRVR